jgi:hypothetical protein
VQGGSPLEVYAFARLDEERIAIGDARRQASEPVARREDAPALEGPARPYQELLDVAFFAVPDRSVGRLGDSLVFGLDGPPRLCSLPAGPPRRRFRGCAPDAPALLGPLSRRPGVADDEAGTVWYLDGPLVVWRAGNAVEKVVHLSGGQGGWLVE